MDKKDRELLIRIDQTVSEMHDTLSNPPYQGLVEKVKTHGRIIWPSMGLAVSAALKAFLGGSNG